MELFVINLRIYYSDIENAKEVLNVAEKFIFVMFSSTPHKMGRFIQLVTNNCYNHVSLCLDVKGVTLYSFARKYRKHPFYGGFVQESGERFVHNNRFAQIKLCAIPVSDVQYGAIRSIVETMENESDTYIYNHFNAAATMIRKKVKLDNAYTCVEFVAEILSDVDIFSSSEMNHVISVRDLEDILQQYQIYEGSFEQIAFQVSQAGDKFCAEQKIYDGMLKACWTNIRLFYSLLRNVIWY